MKYLIILSLFIASCASQKKASEDFKGPHPRHKNTSIKLKKGTTSKEKSPRIFGTPVTGDKKANGVGTSRKPMKKDIKKYETTPKDNCKSNKDCFCRVFDGEMFYDKREEKPFKCCLKKEGCEGYDVKIVPLNKCMDCFYD